MPRLAPTSAARQRRRRLFLEQMEDRRMLVSDWTDAFNPRDVNGDGLVVPVDVLLVINKINNDGSGPLPLPRPADTPSYDTTGDGILAPIDVLEVINAINFDGSGPEFDVGLINDTAPGGGTNNDRLTSDARIMGSVRDTTGITSLRGTWNNEPMVLEYGRDGAIEFTPPADGSGSEDGTHTVQLTATDARGNSATYEFSFILDTTPPTIALATNSPVRSATSTVDVRFSEAVSDTSLSPSSYLLRRQDGSELPPTQATRRPLNVVQLQLPDVLADGSYQLELATELSDLAGNVLTGPTEFPLEVNRLTSIQSLSPTVGEQLVSVTRETIVRFDNPIDPSTVTDDSFFLVANGERIAGRGVVSSTERFMTFFYDEPLPAATEVRVVVDGNLIQGRDGKQLDADGNGVPGGVAAADFSTLPLTRIAGTNVFGFVRDSYTGQPIAGVTIRVDAFPEANVVTDANGRFELKDMPAPDFFVHIDGSTSTSAPAGFGYPIVGKPFHSIPGQTVQLEMDGQTFDIFLPPMALNDIQDLSDSEPTAVGFGTAGMEELARMFPDVDPAVFERMAVTIAPGAAVDEQGNTATQALVIPVPPDRIPAPLPPNLNPSLVVSIQAPGATNFDIPASVTFPNLDGLPPGEKTLIMSFDHDAGRWVVNGTATVSEDGLSITSDPGTGINAPGWHITNPGSTPFFPTNPFVPPPDRDDDGAPDVTDPDDDNDEIPDREESDPEYEYEITVGVQGGARFKPPTIEFLAGLNVPNAVLGIPGDEQFVVGYHNEWKPFGDERPGSFDFSFSFRLSEFWADFIEPMSITLPTFQVSAELSAGLGVAGVIDITGGEPELEFDNIELRPGNIQLAFSFQIRDTFLCHLPFDIGETICQTFSKTFTYGAPNVEMDEVSIPLDRVPLFDYNADFFAGLSLSTSTSASVSPRVYVQKRRVPVPPANAPSDSGSGEAEANTPSVSESSSIAGVSQVYLLLEMQNGTQIRTVDSVLNQGNLVLPSDTEFTLYAYSPLTNRTAVLTDRTGPSGSMLRRNLPMTQIGGYDLDGDGIPDLGEQVLGTSLDDPDTDGDGISDRAELEQGLNPLDNRGFPTGIIASLPLRGEAKAVTLEGSTQDSARQLAYLATGSHGVAIVDASRFNNPIILGQLDLPGDAVDIAVDGERQLAVVAAGAGGLHVVDVADPMQPVLVRSLPVAATQVELFEGVAYVAVGPIVHGLDLTTGELLEQVLLGSNAITGLARESELLLALTSGKTLHAITLSNTGMVVRDSVTLQHGAGKLFVGGGVAYVPATSYSRGGFATVDVSNPHQLAVISESDVVSPLIAPATMIVPSGSGLGLLLGRPGSQGVADVMNLSDLNETNRLLTRFVLPATPFDAALGSGIAFIADGTAGMQVVNFVPFDNLRQPPTVTLRSTAIDIAPDVAGTQVQEGTSLAILSDVRDDVQVRNVQLLMDGQVVANDVSFPFEFAINVPRIGQQGPSMSLRLRATDTGGNIADSDVLVLNIVPDTVAPTIANIVPSDGGWRFEGHRTVRIRFSESMDPTTLTADKLQLVALSNPSQPIPLEDIQWLRDDHEVLLTFAELDVDEYQLTIQASGMTDRAGNSLAGGTVVTSFGILEKRDPGGTLPTALDIGLLDAVFALDERIGQDVFGNPDPVDLIRFHLDAPREVRFDLTNRVDGSQLRLIADLDGDGQIDNGEVLRSRSSSTKIDLSLAQNLEAGAYFVQILPYSTGDVTPYSLTILPGAVIVTTTPEDPGETLGTALPLGTLANAPVSYRDMYGVRDTFDYYKFTIDQPRLVTIDLTGRLEGGYMRLIADLDGDGQIDGKEELRSAGSSSAIDSNITRNLEAGEYFIQVGYNGFGDITPYTLTVTPGAIIVPTTPQDPGQTLGTALPLGTLTTTPVSYQDMYGVRDTVDYYKFTIDQPRLVTIALTGRLEGGYMRLIADLDGDGQIDGNEELRNAGSSGAANASITQNLEAGEYFIQVGYYWFGHITPYTLTVTPGAVIVPTTPQDPGQTLGTALPLGTLATTPVSYQDMYGVRDTVDYYKFTIDQPRLVTINLTGRLEGGYMRLIADLDGDGQIDGNEELRNAGSSGAANASITQNLEAGEYFIQVGYYWFGHITPYTLTVTPGAVIVPTTPQDPGQTFGTALPLGTLATTPVSYQDMYGVRDTVDYYKFTIDQPRLVTIDLTGRLEGGYMRLIADLDGDGQLDGNEELRNAGNSGAANARITQNLEAGEYFVQVGYYWFGHITPYTLTVTPGAVIVPTTPQDPGQTFGTALPLGTLATTPVSYQDMYGVRDTVDYYKFTIDQPRLVTIDLTGRLEGGYMRLIADLDGDGQLDGNEELRNAGSSSASNARITQNLEAGEYFIQVGYYWFGHITPYTLTVTPGEVIVPTTPQDPGQTLGTALPLGTLATTPVSYQDMYGVRDTVDYYKFTIDQPRLVTIDLTGRLEGGFMRLIADLDGDGQLDGGEELRNAGGSSASNATITQNLAAGEYFIQVGYYWFGNITPYTLTVTPG